MPAIDPHAVAGGALAFAVAIAWNEAAMAAIRAVFPADKRSSTRAYFAYAIAVTMMVIVAVAIVNYSGQKVTDVRDALTGEYHVYGMPRRME